MPPPLTVDVAIIGAGPGGLSAALAIKKASPTLSVRVYERARALRPSGGCIGISTPNAFDALGAMGSDVLSSVRAAGVDRRYFRTADMQGNVLSQRLVPSTIISWFELQGALLACLPPDVMQLHSAAQEVRAAAWAQVRRCMLSPPHVSPHATPARSWRRPQTGA